VRHAEWCCPVVPNVTPAPYTSDDTPRVAATFVHSPRSHLPRRSLGQARTCLSMYM
jgi:hypothetical protein